MKRKQPFKPYELPIFSCENPRLSSVEKLKLMDQVVEAMTLMERFKNKLESSHIKDAVMFVFSLNESIQSTKIEGTQATFDEYLESQTAGKYNEDTQEVKNYLEALKEGADMLETFPISTRMFLELHKLILRDSRGKNKAPGMYRKTQNWIGGSSTKIEDATYIPPEAQYIDKYMSNLEKYINNEISDELHPLIKVGIIHAQFESIHPFLDGNGRIGRILIILYLIKENIIKKPNFFVSEELERNKYKYYALLNNLRNETPKWYEWLSFFLDSIIKQTEKYLGKLEQIENLRTSLDIYKADDRVVYYVFQNPVFQVKDIVNYFSKLDDKKYHISYGTAKKNVQILVDNQKLFHNEKKRNRIYRFYELLDILQK